MRNMSRDVLTLATMVILISAAAPPVAANTVTGLTLSPAEGTAPVTITATVTGASGYCGAVNIDWGDGAAVTYATEQLPVTQTHEYKTGGNFTVRAQGMGNCTGTATAAVAIKGPPVVAQFTGLALTPNPATAKTPVNIALQGTGGCRVTLDFGDGNTQDVDRELPATVPHTYSLPGAYTVVATPASSCGERRTARLEITGRQVPARLTGLDITSPPGARASLRQLRVAGTGSCTYTLDYGDGNKESRTATLPEELQHHYPAAGRYEVVVTASPPCSGSARSAFTTGQEAAQEGRSPTRQEVRGRIERLEMRPPVVRAGDAVVITVLGSGTCRMTVDFDDGQSRDVTQALPYKLAYIYSRPGTYEVVVWTDEPCVGQAEGLVRVR